MPSYLVELFGLSRIEAMEAIYAWMMTFSPDKSLDERVALAEGSRRGPTLAEGSGPGSSASWGPRTSSPQTSSFPRTAPLANKGRYLTYYLT